MFVAWFLSSGEDGRRYRNRDDTTEGGAVASDNSEDEGRKPPKKKAYSCASVTSPVMADRPIYGFVGIEMSFSVKQLLHSSPVDIKTRHQIKSLRNTHSLSTGSSPRFVLKVRGIE